MGTGVCDGTKNWIFETLTHTLAKISEAISSFEADARSSGSPVSPPPEVSSHILSCSWVLLLGLFQRRELGEAREGRAAGEGPCEWP